jgi:dihydroorotase
MDRRSLLVGAIVGTAVGESAAQEPRPAGRTTGSGAAGAPPAQPVAYEYDLVLQGGHLVDPANNIDGIHDVGILAGKIAAVGRKLSTRRARRVLSVKGRWVFPGLVDIHVHGYGYSGAVTLDEHAFMNGTTTVVDAGGGGWKSYDALSAAIRRRPSGVGGRGGFVQRPAGRQGAARGVDEGQGGRGTRPQPNAGQRGGPGAGGGAAGGFGGFGGAGFDPARLAGLLGARVRAFAFLNIVGEGMLGGRVENNMEDMDAQKAAECVLAHQDLLVGIKTAHFGGPRGPLGWTAVDRAVKAGELCKKPVMVDFDPREDRPYGELVLQRLRPGDIHTHVFAQHIPVLDESGKVQTYMWEARKRGILFDVGHGGGSFWFRVAAPAIRQGFIPDSISTDMHRNSLLIPQATMPMVMSKLLNLGVPLRDVVLRSTANPARQIAHPELGTLSVGAGADVSVFELEEGDFGFIDSGHASMRGKKRLRCHLTLRDGVVAYDLNGVSWKDWKDAGSYRTLDQYGEERRRRGPRRQGQMENLEGGASPNP